MKVFYPALFHEENGSYWVEFPDVEGCHTFGDTLNETIENAKEALEGHIFTLLSEGIELPKASNIKEIPTDDNSFVSFIEIELINYDKCKAVKKTLTIPEWLNTLAVKNNINFSQVLQQALMENIIDK